MRKKHRRKTNRTVIQDHHVSYDPEWIETVWRGEHFILSQIQWRKRYSKGFINSLKEFIRVNESLAFELKKEVSLVEKGV